MEALKPEEEITCDQLEKATRRDSNCYPTFFTMRHSFSPVDIFEHESTAEQKMATTK